jgi:hypothetical protein
MSVSLRKCTTWIGSPIQFLYLNKIDYIDYIDLNKACKKDPIG